MDTATDRAVWHNRGISLVSTFRRLAEQTPDARNRVVDLMRVASILVVVFGHWLMAAVKIEDGELIPGHLLVLASWTHPLTWLLQVMPIFFFVGGYANALSWRSASRTGETYGSWLRSRLRRLILPVIPLLVLWMAGGWLALQSGLDWQVLWLASQVALVPTWFLAAYVVIISLAPLFLALWDRFGMWTVVTGIALAGLCDFLSISHGVVWVGFLNYIFVWGTVHQLGYAWCDGRFSAWPRRAAAVAVGFAAAWALVRWGPYPVAMVGLDTAEVTNSYPPRVTLAFLGLFQAGLVLLAEPLLARWMRRLRPWTFVVAVSSLIMTIYLWHLTAMVIALGFGLVFGGAFFAIEPLSAAWWWTRPLWFAALTVLTLLLALVFGRFERPDRDPRPAPPGWRPVLAVVLVCSGLGFLAAFGIADEDGLNGLILTLPIAGVILGGIARMPARRRTS